MKADQENGCFITLTLPVFTVLKNNSKAWGRCSPSAVLSTLKKKKKHQDEMKTENEHSSFVFALKSACNIKNLLFPPGSALVAFDHIYTR